MRWRPVSAPAPRPCRGGAGRRAVPCCPPRRPCPDSSMPGRTGRSSQGAVSSACGLVGRWIGVAKARVCSRQVQQPGDGLAGDQLERGAVAAGVGGGAEQDSESGGVDKRQATQVEQERAVVAGFWGGGGVGGGGGGGGGG